MSDARRAAVEALARYDALCELCPPGCNCMRCHVRALLAEQERAVRFDFVRVEHPSPSTWALPEDDEGPSLSAEGFEKLSEEILAVRAARVGAVPLDGPARIGECGICCYAPCICATPPAPPPAPQDDIVVDDYGHRNFITCGDAPPPAPPFGSTSTVRSDSTPAQPLPTCVNCGSNFIAPPPAPEARCLCGGIYCGECKGREPRPDEFRAEIGRLRDAMATAQPAPSDAVREAAERLREVASSGVEFDDERLDYVTVQIDRETWDAVRRLAARGGE